MEQVRSRTKSMLLDARTEVHGGKRRFVRGPRYAELPPEVVAAVPAAFEAYLASLPEEEKPAKASFEIVDQALRIAGTGSLGGLRIAVLVKGKHGSDGSWIFDMKEQGDPSASPICGAPSMPPAERVLTAFRACVDPPRMMGATKLGAAGSFSNLSLFVRKLSPQEDKLNLRRLRGADLPALATHLGHLLGAAHAKGATKAPKAKWSQKDLECIREHAIELAGIHEAVYLALCGRMRTAVGGAHEDVLRGLLPKT